MKKLIVVLVLLLAAGVAYAKDYEIKKKAGGYDVEVKIDKNPPVVGDNNIEIEIKDSVGKYVTDAKVTVEYSMPAMGSMAAHKDRRDAKLAKNSYKATMHLSMGGVWNIAVKIKRGDKMSTVKFNVDAR